MTRGGLWATRRARVMDKATIDTRLSEYGRIRPDPGRDERCLLETALFVEETFGITLSDEEIDFGTLGTFEGIQRLITARQLGM
jgi:hypothetical protein